MTAKTFFACLCILRRTGWKRWIPRNKTKFDADQLRIRSPENSRCFCPVVAVAYLKTGKKRYFDKAARLICLDGDFENRVLFSADKKTWHPRVRKKLFKALGLSELE